MYIDRTVLLVNAQNVRASGQNMLNQAFRVLSRRRLRADMESTTCRICGKPLKVQKSVERGIGPVCWAKMKKGGG